MITAVIVIVEYVRITPINEKHRVTIVERGVEIGLIMGSLRPHDRIALVR